MSTIDVIILNRNLKDITESLAIKLESFKEVSGVFVVDSGSEQAQVARGTFARDDSAIAREYGLRISRGFNLGISHWLKSSSSAEWVLLLPNDAELISADFQKLLIQVNSCESIVAVVPMSETNPYGPLINESGVALGWLFHEGPLLVSSQYLKKKDEIGSTLFDNSNFRGFSSFLEIAFQAYAANYCLAITNLVQFTENSSHLINHHMLIGTESYDENLNLLLLEGRKWLARKYGFTDRKNLELVTRFLFQHFITAHPEIPFPPAN